MPLKEFRCAAHGPFEALCKADEIAACPKGCSKRFVKQEIRTAPSYHAGKTGKLDAIQKDLASSYGLPDLKSDKDDGRSLMDRLRRTDPSKLAGQMESSWAEVPGHMQPGWSKRGEKPVSVTPRTTFGMEGGNAMDKSLDMNKMRSMTRVERSVKAEDIK